MKHQYVFTRGFWVISLLGITWFFASCEIKPTEQGTQEAKIQLGEGSTARCADDSVILLPNPCEEEEEDVGTTTGKQTRINPDSLVAIEGFFTTGVAEPEELAGRNARFYRGVEDADVLLVDANDDLIDMVVSNESGKYKFEVDGSQLEYPVRLVAVSENGLYMGTYFGFDDAPYFNVNEVTTAVSQTFQNQKLQTREAYESWKDIINIRYFGVDESGAPNLSGDLFSHSDFSKPAHLGNLILETAGTLGLALQDPATGEETLFTNPEFLETFAEHIQDVDDINEVLAEEEIPGEQIREDLKHIAAAEGDEELAAALSQALTSINETLVFQQEQIELLQVQIDELNDAFLENKRHLGPTAYAGPDQQVILGTSIVLDGSTSQNPTGTSLSYQWRLLAKPSQSLVTLSNPGAAIAAFTPDVIGNYVISLEVDNGVQRSSDAVSIIVTPGGAPVIEGISNQEVLVETPILLDASSSSDPDGDVLTFQWELIAQPLGDDSSFSHPDISVTSFLPKTVGSYILKLTVSDGIHDTVQSLVITAKSLKEEIPDDTNFEGARVPAAESHFLEEESHIVQKSKPGKYTVHVPEGVFQMRVRAWGAGGKGGKAWAYDGSNGGAGGYAESWLEVTPGESLLLTVGRSGACSESQEGPVDENGCGSVTINGLDVMLGGARGVPRFSGGHEEEIHFSDIGADGGGASVVMREDVVLVAAGGGGGGTPSGNQSPPPDGKGGCYESLRGSIGNDGLGGYCYGQYTLMGAGSYGGAGGSQFESWDPGKVGGHGWIAIEWFDEIQSPLSYEHVGAFNQQLNITSASEGEVTDPELSLEVFIDSDEMMVPEIESVLISMNREMPLPYDSRWQTYEPTLSFTLEEIQTDLIYSEEITAWLQTKSGLILPYMSQTIEVNLTGKVSYPIEVVEECDRCVQEAANLSDEDLESLEVHVIGVYDSDGGSITVDYNIEAPSVLVLNIYEAADWYLELSPDANLKAVILMSYEEDQVVYAPNGFEFPIIQAGSWVNAYDISKLDVTPGSSSSIWSAMMGGSTGFITNTPREQINANLMEWLGTEMTSFVGEYSASQFVIEPGDSTFFFYLSEFTAMISRLSTADRAMYEKTNNTY